MPRACTRQDTWTCISCVSHQQRLRDDPLAWRTQCSLLPSSVTLSSQRPLPGPRPPDARGPLADHGLCVQDRRPSSLGQTSSSASSPPSLIWRFVDRLRRVVISMLVTELQTCL